MKYIIIIGMLLWSMGSQLFARTSNTHTTIQQHDSINAAALDPNFIHASILLMSEGDEIYSIFGHTAIRMQCPSKNLDYCFTFEMDMEKNSWIDFITHDAKAGFAPAETPTFLKQYTASGRGVKAYELNLTPKEKQKLWQVLDEQSTDGSSWTFDYYHINCTSMVFFAINSCLQRGDHLSFQHTNPVLLQNYHAVVNYSAAPYVWSRLFWNTMIIGNGNKQGEVTDMITPKLLGESMSSIVITDSSAHQRPFIIGKIIQLTPIIVTPLPCWFTPKMAIALICILIITLPFAFIRWKKQKKVKAIKEVNKSKHSKSQEFKEKQKYNQHKTIK